MHRRHEAELLERALQLEVRRDLGEALQQVAAFYCVRTQTANAVVLMGRSGA